METHATSLSLVIKNHLMSLCFSHILCFEPRERIDHCSLLLPWGHFTDHRCEIIHRSDLRQNSPFLPEEMKLFGDTLYESLRFKRRETKAGVLVDLRASSVWVVVTGKLLTVCFSERGPVRFRELLPNSCLNRSDALLGECRLHTV